MVVGRHHHMSQYSVYDEHKNQVSERYWSPSWERWRVSDRMQWYTTSKV